MAIVLTDYEHTARVVKSGHDQWNVVAGTSVGVGTTNPTVIKLLAECPAGKVWSVRVIVEITETDA